MFQMLDGAVHIILLLFDSNKLAVIVPYRNNNRATA
jgi:hypothetical protein